MLNSHQLFKIKCRGNNNFSKGILIFNCDFPFTSGIPDSKHCLISNTSINCSRCKLYIFKCGFSNIE